MSVILSDEEYEFLVHTVLGNARIDWAEVCRGTRYAKTTCSLSRPRATDVHVRVDPYDMVVRAYTTLIPIFDLEAGDVLLHHPESAVGRLLVLPQKPSSVTGRKYSHADIVYAPGVVVGAQKHGVVVVNPEDWADAKMPIEVWRWPGGLTPDKGALVREYIDAHMGDPYPYTHLALILYYLLTGQRHRARIRSRLSVCSAFCTRALRHAGLDAVPGYDESVETPTDITEGNLGLIGYLDVRQAVRYAAQYRPERDHFAAHARLAREWWKE